MYRVSSNTWLIAAIATFGAATLLGPVLLNNPVPAAGLTAGPDTNRTEDAPGAAMVLPGDTTDTATVRTPELETPVSLVLQPLAPDVPDVAPMTRRGAGKLVRRGSLLGRLRRDLAMLGQPDYASTVGSWYYDMPEDQRPPNEVVRDMEAAFQLFPDIRLKPEEGAELARVFADQDWGALQASDGMSFVVAYLGVPRLRQELSEEQVRLLEYMLIIP